MDDIKACFGYASNFIPKKELVDGGWYLGKCRNANYAQWDAENNCFIYLRLKLANLFVVEIHHPENDDGFDLFFPLAKLIVQKNILVDLRQREKQSS